MSGAAGWRFAHLAGPAATMSLVLLGGSAAGATKPAPRPEFSREVLASGAGLTAVVLDRHVYEAARRDLADLRVETEASETVPFVLDRGGSPGSQPRIEPRVRNRGTSRGGAASAVLDFGERTDKASLSLRLPGTNFRRRVSVEGSESGGEWTTLTENAWVFAIPGPEPLRHETLPLPENDFPLLRVTVHPGPDETERLAIDEAFVPAGERSPLREASLAPRWSRADEPSAGETFITLDLGARHQPCHAVTLDVEDERFFREVRVEARRDPEPARDGVAGPVRWEEIGRGVVYRLEHGGKPSEGLSVEARGRERVLRLRVRNGDDRPLRVRDVSVRVPVERVVFEAGPGHRYRLTYGAPDRSAARHDLARTLGERAEAAPVAEMGPPVRLDARAEPAAPWTERHPALLWIGLVAVALALASMTWRALRQA
jgi:Protein of unknown function (DUF3999)